MRGGWNHNIHYHRVLLTAVPRPCERALDVGCGDGAFALRLADLAGQVEGIDVSGGAIAAAAPALRDRPNVSLHVGDFMEHEFDGTYDFVSAIASLHHMPFETALTRMKDLLRPGGTLAVLGCYDERTKVDLLVSLFAVPVNRGYLRKYGKDSSSLPTARPTMSLAEIRSAARRVLPGARVRRRLFWRYSLVWQRPTTEDARGRA